MVSRLSDSPGIVQIVTGITMDSKGRRAGRPLHRISMEKMVARLVQVAPPPAYAVPPPLHVGQPPLPARPASARPVRQSKRVMSKGWLLLALLCLLRTMTAQHSIRG